MAELKVYISYIKFSNGRQNHSQNIYEKISKQYIKKNITVLTNNDFINDDSEYEKYLSAGNFVTIILSSDLLKNKSGIFELQQINRFPKFNKQVFTIVLDDARINSISVLAEINSYWNAILKNLKNKIANISDLAEKEKIINEIQIIQNILSFVEKYSINYSDTITLKPEDHKNKDFSIVLKSAQTNIKIKPELKASNNFQDRKKSKKLIFIILITALLLISVVSFFVFNNKDQEPKSTNNETKKNELKDTIQTVKEIIEFKDKKDTTGYFQYCNTEYEKAIKKADGLFATEDFSNAKAFYMKSLKIFDKPYPHLQINKIDSLLKEKQKPKDGFILVEGGTYQMHDRDGDVMGVTQVKVNSFYIDMYEVTVYKFRKFCEATGRTMPSEPSFGWNDDNPIVNVTWKEVQKYAEWAGKRLPTSAEWEFAAIGGNKSSGFAFSGSNNPDEVSWYWDNSGEKTHAVGLKKPNELGIYDMSGNVWEWCSDWYEDKEFLGDTLLLNPRGPDKGMKRILRGGSWYSFKEYVKIYSQTKGSPNYKYAHIGFRLAWDTK